MADVRCVAQNTADPLFFLHAIMGADCSMALGAGGQPYICDNQINLGDPRSQAAFVAGSSCSHRWCCVADQLPGATATAGPYMDDRGTPEVFIDMIHTPDEWTTSPTAGERGPLPSDCPRWTALLTPMPCCGQTWTTARTTAL